MNDSGTNSVKPPVWRWMSRNSRRCSTQCRGVSMWPYMIVDVVRMPSSCAEVMTSIHWSRVIRPGAIRSRTSCTRISADVPGSVVAAEGAERAVLDADVGEVDVAVDDVGDDVTRLAAPQLIGDARHHPEREAARGSHAERVLVGDPLALERAGEGEAQRSIHG